MFVATYKITEATFSGAGRDPKRGYPRNHEIKYKKNESSNIERGSLYIQRVLK